MKTASSRAAPFAIALVATRPGAGCAAVIDQGTIEQRTALAIGRPPGSFTVANQVEDAGGGIDYRVRTKDGVARSAPALVAPSRRT